LFDLDLDHGTGAVTDEFVEVVNTSGAGEFDELVDAQSVEVGVADGDERLSHERPLRYVHKNALCPTCWEVILGVGRFRCQPGR
jgi:hypothetical protein